jgi:hypothetical protein
MFSFLAKALFAGATVALVTVIARRHPGWGGLLAALPLTSILALSLLWIETGDRNRVADLSRSILIFIVPSLPLFFVLPPLLRSVAAFWLAMALCIVGTLALYAIAFWSLPRLGVKL